MRKTARQHGLRLLLLGLLAGTLGWFVWWCVDWWLAPRPVFEVPVSTGEMVSFAYNVVGVYKDDKHVRSYRLSDGTLLDLKDFRRATDKRHPLTGTSDQAAQGYLVERFQIKNTEITRYMLFDSQTGEAYQFHDIPGAWYQDVDWITFDQHRPVRACLCTRSLPVHAIFGLGLSIAESPASALLHLAASANPRLAPKIIRVVSIPNKQTISSFILDTQWDHENFAVSPSGHYVACITPEYISPYTKQLEPTRQRIWDVKAGAWVTLHPETNLIRSGQPHLFLNDEVLAAQAAKASDLRRNGGVHFLNVKTGRLIDQLPTIYFSDHAHEVVCSGTELWYLKWVELESKRFRWELRHSADSVSTETVASMEIDDKGWFSCLTEGPQTVYSPTPSWKRWLYDFMNQHSSLEFIRPWLNSYTTFVHDWNSNQSYAVWSGYHRWQRNHDGKYLTVSFGETDNRGIMIGGGLAQVFRMPLTLYSPWWSRGAGIGMGVLVFILFWRMLGYYRSPVPS